jgi:hypothetical protein
MDIQNKENRLECGTPKYESHVMLQIGLPVYEWMRLKP